MRIGMIGLGRMGANMARRLIRGGHEVVVTDSAMRQKFGGHLEPAIEEKSA